MLILHSIAFNVDTGSTEHSALNIRKNRDETVPFPEHNSAVGTSGDAAPIAYAIEDTNHGRSAIVRVTFTASTALSVFSVRANGGGILGSVPEFTVQFAPPSTPPFERTVDIPLQGAAFDFVGRYEPEWEWECRADGESNWSPLATTRHLVYLTLAAPKPPWSLDPADKTVPWADLLEHACTKASGNTPTRKWRTVRALTRALNTEYGLRYDITRGGKASYGYKYIGAFGEESFFLQEWIHRALNNNPRTDPDPDIMLCDPSGTSFPADLTVGCFDMAASLTLMATALGVDVSYRLHKPFGYLNVIVPVGREPCNDPFYFFGCIPTDKIRPDDPGRHFYDTHTYVTYQNGNYDATMRFRPSRPFKFSYKMLDYVGRLIRLALALARLDIDWHLRYRDKAEGLITDMPQGEYERKLIDRSTDIEEEQATGQPVAHEVRFQTEGL